MERSRRSSAGRSQFRADAARHRRVRSPLPPTAPTPPLAPRRARILAAHDDERVDDYYWLRDRDDPAVRAYLDAENAYTAALTAHADRLQHRLFEEIRGRVQETDVSVPAAKGPWAYYARTIEGRQYQVHCRRPSDRSGLPDAFESPGREDGEVIVLDENALAEGHDYFSLGGLTVSPDHAVAAYATDTTGAERFTLRFRELATGTALDDIVPETSYGLAWANDATTIFYTRPDAANRPYQVWRHRLGGADDELVYEDLDERFFVAVGRFRSDRYLIVMSQSKTTSEAHLVDADAPELGTRLVAARRTGVEYHVEHHPSVDHGDRLFIVTNDEAPNFRLVGATVDRPDDWQEIIAGRDDVRLDAVDAFADHLVLEERADALTRLRVMRLADGELHEPVLPDPVFAVELGTNLEFASAAFRLRYTSLVRPTTVYDYDAEARLLTLLKQQPVLGGFDATNYTSARLWAAAPDGTRVPISVVHRVDAPPDGTHPCLRYGYGAYEISIDPTFSAARVSLLDRGMTFAIAHVRGGGELGRAWYDAGKLANKPAGFTDFLACADALVAGGYARPDGIVARGGSAGGLLMGATTNLRPDAFRAVVAEVPFVDCLSTMLDRSLPLTVTEFDEWGDPGSDRDVYELIKSYSPYDNVRAVPYPAMLVTAGLNDPRVQYWEPAKWVAKLRATTTGDAPIYLKTEMGAGHAGRSGRYEAWREEAFVLAFVLEQVGLAESDRDV